MINSIKLTADFSTEEFTNSKTAEEEGISNTAEAKHIQNLRRLCIHVLQPLRSFLNRPVHVTSGYRSPKLNEAVGGVENSFHKQGLAADVTVEDLTAEDLEWMIEQTNLPYEECIGYPEKGHVHVALDEERV